MKLNFNCPRTQNFLSQLVENCEQAFKNETPLNILTHLNKVTNEAINATDMNDEPIFEHFEAVNAVRTSSEIIETFFRLENTLKALKRS